jgi:hypothetical protein
MPTPIHKPLHEAMANAPVELKDLKINMEIAPEGDDLKHLQKDALKKMLDRVTNSIRQRHQMSVSEFSKFLPLFRKDGVSRLGQDNYDILSQEYTTRVSAMEKLEIVDDSGNVILTLPPILLSCPVFNKIDPLVLDKFYVLSSREGNILSSDPERGSLMMTTALKNLMNTSEWKDAQKEITEQHLKLIHQYRQSRAALAQGHASAPVDPVNEDGSMEALFGL